ncbi:unnamed protein product [Mytilus edulis]|uniref:Uncharacterized protein n=1 Tax=Mytilus edulis TaxID=6550 RepID=A0A8S3S7W9_MYTED|nr:unnamed protein product [Mytilus edulis]
MSDKCYLFNNTFNYSVKRKRYNRVSIDSKLSRNNETVREVLTCFGCTPEKLADNMLVCLECTQLLSKHQSNKKKVESLNELRLKTSGTYLGHKIEFLSSPTETTSSKRVKVNTPKKMIAFAPRKIISNTEKQKKAFLRLNHLGLTLSTDAVRSAVDRLRMTYDKELIAHKNRISTYINDQAGPRRRLFTDDEGKTLVDNIYKNQSF